MHEPIAIVGMACRYPDADSPAELWENVLSCRRAFRRMPDERLRLADYFDQDPKAPDRTYSPFAAVLKDYEFDRLAFKVVGSTYRSADLAHWLALEVASEAIQDAGDGEDGQWPPRDATGVILGNTLTGEFSRANVMRLRWPYVQRVVDARLIDEGWAETQRATFLAALEQHYKQPFPEIGEETLAGGLSNTIAGRICNHFDLHGGGYTVDGACASSLLAVCNACSLLTAGDLDVALAGGVDLSLDPFELVGFAKTGALAPELMRVYDARSGGFWPGEGCGFFVLMRRSDALASGRRIYATIEGWGVSSDGSGGITRPDPDGQLLALRRAYRRAGFGIDRVAYHEGHGTGTALGDETELAMLSRARRELSLAEAPTAAALGSVKANIGHTKAAAGAAGLIKAVMAVHEQIVPPVTGCQTDHPAVKAGGDLLTLPRSARMWPDDRAICASVSAMGFGGINTHVVIQGSAIARRATLTARERSLTRSGQDGEVFLFSGRDGADIRSRIERLREFAARISFAEMGDLAATLAAELAEGPCRAAVVASRPDQLAERLGMLRESLDLGDHGAQLSNNGVFYVERRWKCRVGLLFPGQGAPVLRSGGAAAARFEAVADLFDCLELPEADDDRDTAVAQPAICASSMAGLRLLRLLGIEGHVAIGHSLGELTALHWAGAYDESALLRLATARGAAMSNLGDPTGGMASILADEPTVRRLISGSDVVVAGLNGAKQTVVSGSGLEIGQVVERAAAHGVRAVRLPVSHAFHSPLVAAAVPALHSALERERLSPPVRSVISTVTGQTLAAETDLVELLLGQVTQPVRFTEAAAAMAAQVDVIIEVGPGRVLSGLISELAGVPCFALEVGGSSLAGVLEAAAAVWTCGGDVAVQRLFDDRVTKPFALDFDPSFLSSPCELAPVSGLEVTPAVSNVDRERIELVEQGVTSDAPIDVLRRLVAERAEFPVDAVRDDMRMLSDLHLNSLTVGQIVGEVTSVLKLAPMQSVTEFADATVREIAIAIESLKANSSGHRAERAPVGVRPWIREFAVAYRPEAPPSGETPHGTYDWSVRAPEHQAIPPDLEHALREAAGCAGVLVWLPRHVDEQAIGMLLAGAKEAMQGEPRRAFVLVQEDGSAFGFAKSLHMESPDGLTVLIDAAADLPGIARRIAHEVAGCDGFVEVVLGPDGQRLRPELAVLPEAAADAPDLSATDVLLVTGGGKGIAAECALALAKSTGCRLALLGRSDRDEDDVLAGNLSRLEAHGVQWRYQRADVCNATEVSAAIAAIRRELGPVTAVLHGAGLNVPRAIRDLNATDVERTIRPKVDGLQHVLAAIEASELRLLVTFGSIIARIGLHGEADYALANGMLGQLCEGWSAAQPHCRVLNVEWSVWSGVGMGERLGRVDLLMQHGITPITPDEGVTRLQGLLRRGGPSGSVVVAGRFGEPPTMPCRATDLPLWRFLERTRVNIADVELVVDATVSSGTDPYLNDHVFEGQRVFPGVVGLEAMAQAACALVGAARPSSADHVAFRRPVIIGEEPEVLRVCALKHADGSAEVVLRCGRTDFAVDHFSARFHFTEAMQHRPTGPEINGLSGKTPAEAEGLYDKICFQRGRFQRVTGYYGLSARRCEASIGGNGEIAWFDRFRSSDLVLGDPGARDSSIHAIQACIPHRTILPMSVELIQFGPSCGDVPLTVSAEERTREGDEFVYDLWLTGSDGRILERWCGLRLRAVGAPAIRTEWRGMLLRPYLERRLGDLLGTRDVEVELDARATQGALANGAGHGEGQGMLYRPDGKPECAGSGGAYISASESSGWRLVVRSVCPVGCDLEEVNDGNAAHWQRVLGAEGRGLCERIAKEAAESTNEAATRIWCARECLKKAGCDPTAGLTICEVTADGWVVLGTGRDRIASYRACLDGAPRPVMFATLLAQDDA